MSNCALAVRLARAGLYVLPCDPATKAPRLPKWTALATNKERGVKYYWERYGADAMPGIALGLCGLVAVDIDVKYEIDGLAAFDCLLDNNGEFPACPVTRTPSGGFHLVFRQPAGRSPLGNATGALPRGIDIRGAGGQIIAPGAVRDDGTFYESVAGWPDLIEAFCLNAIPEIPAWLVDLVNLKSSGESVASDCTGTESSRSSDKSNWVSVALDAQARALADTARGGRNNALNAFVFTFAGHAANGWTTQDEVYAAAHWACELNGYLASADGGDGPDNFARTFRGAWRDGFGKPTKGPQSRPISFDPQFAAGLIRRAG